MGGLEWSGAGVEAGRAVAGQQVGWLEGIVRLPKLIVWLEPESADNVFSRWILHHLDLYNEFPADNKRISLGNLRYPK